MFPKDFILEFIKYADIFDRNKVINRYLISKGFQLKHKFKMNVLTVTVRPPLETELGRKNLVSFIKSLI